MASGPPLHHLAAILNGDVVGYSRLVSLDEDHTVRALAASRELVAARVSDHRGRLADFVGDNFLAEFPSAVEAVGCALDIRREIEERNGSLPAERRVEFRLGIHLGDVRAEGEQLFGSGVNVAARLREMAQPGQICISAEVREQVRGRLDLDCEDLGAQSVKNIPEPVHAYQIRAGARAAPSTHPAVRRRRRLRAFAAGLAGLALAVPLAVWATWPLVPGLLLDALGLGVERGAPTLSAGASLVVLPFAALGEQVPDYLAEGITEDLTTDLYGIPDLLVVSRNTAFGYREASVDLRVVGRELGVRYAVQGTVRGVADRIRVTVSLSDTGTGVQIWGERYDRVADDLLALQSEISEQILTALSLRVDEAEIARIRRKRTQSLSAYEAVKRASAEFYHFRRDANERARALYRRAIEIDPEYAEAYALLANTYNYEYTGGWNQDPALLDRAEELVRKALELDPLSPQGFASLTAVHIARGRWAEAVRAGERCVELAPSYDFGTFLLAMAYGGAGRPVVAYQTFTRGLRLDPRGQAPTLSYLADLNYRAGRVDEGVATWERIRRENPHHIGSRIALAFYYEQTGRLDRAHDALREVLTTNPDYRADRARRSGGRYLSPADTRWLAGRLESVRAEQ